jgi:hypothetical protein
MTALGNLSAAMWMRIGAALHLALAVNRNP